MVYTILIADEGGCEGTMYSTLGETLADLRDEKGLSQRQAAIEMGISKSALGSYETNAHSPDKETLVMLADYYRVSVDYLLGRVSGKVDIGLFDKPHTANETNGTVFNRISRLPQKLKDMLADYLTYFESKQDKSSP